MTAEPDLLPCPGCNGTNTRVIGGPGTRGGPEYWAGCDQCRWRTWGNTEAEAIAAWNRRACVSSATEALQAEIEALRELCGMAYQLAGVHDAPEKWLDALSNAAAGSPFSTDGLLPYMPQAVCDAEAEAKALRAEVAEYKARADAYFKTAERQGEQAERLAEALRERVAKWREQAAREKARRCWVTAAQARQCADDIDALLAKAEG